MERLRKMAEKLLQKIQDENTEPTLIPVLAQLAMVLLEVSHQLQLLRTRARLDSIIARLEDALMAKIERAIQSGSEDDYFSLWKIAQSIRNSARVSRVRDLDWETLTAYASLLGKDDDIQLPDDPETRHKLATLLSELLSKQGAKQGGKE